MSASDSTCPKIKKKKIHRLERSISSRPEVTSSNNEAPLSSPASFTCVRAFLATLIWSISWEQRSPICSGLSARRPGLPGQLGVYFGSGARGGKSPFAASEPASAFCVSSYLLFRSEEEAFVDLIPLFAPSPPWRLRRATPTKTCRWREVGTTN